MGTQNPQRGKTLTKSKTRTKALTATLVLVIGLGLLAGIGNWRRSSSDGVCDSGPRAGQRCANSRQCQTGRALSARCVTSRVASPAPAARLIYSLHPVSPSGSGTPGFGEVLRFNVAASEGDGVVRAFEFLINSTDNNSSGWNTWQDSREYLGLSRSDFTLYESIDSSSRLAATVKLYGAGGEGLDSDTNTYTVVRRASIIFDSPIAIADGTTRTFILRMDTTGASSSLDDTVQVTVAAQESVSDGRPVIGGVIAF